MCDCIYFRFKAHFKFSAFLLAAFFYIRHSARKVWRHVVVAKKFSVPAGVATPASLTSSANISHFKCTLVFLIAQYK